MRRKRRLDRHASLAHLPPPGANYLHEADGPKIDTASYHVRIGSLMKTLLVMAVWLVHSRFLIGWFVKNCFLRLAL